MEGQKLSDLIKKYLNLCAKMNECFTGLDRQEDELTMTEFVGELYL